MVSKEIQLSLKKELKAAKQHASCLFFKLLKKRNSGNLLGGDFFTLFHENSERKLTMRKKLFFLIMLLLIAATVQAADIYVSLDNGKNKNAGTKQAPLKNLWKALEIANVGDKIHLAEGVYPGKMKCNWFLMERPVSIIGGYSNDFSERNPLKYKTLFQGRNENNDKKGSGLGILHLEFDKTQNAPKGFSIVIDGIIFDDGFASSYHATKGKPEGFDTGMWLQGPAKNTADKFASANRYSIYSATASRGEGDITIRNCTFVNGSNIALELSWHKGKVTCVNNVFCNNRMISANVTCSNRDPSVEWEFANNTVLFTWSRLSDLGDMGFGIRNNTGVTANIHDNIIGLNVLTGFDNTKGDSKKKVTYLDNNIFFLNRESDVQMTISPSIAKVRVEDFEDLEGTDGIESIEDNINLEDPNIFAGRINTQYLNAFMSMKYSEATKLDEGQANSLRSALGMPLQGTITTKVDMYANRYPMEDALKLFGAMPGKGAQNINGVANPLVSSAGLDTGKLREGILDSTDKFTEDVLDFSNKLTEEILDSTGALVNDILNDVLK